MQSLNALSPMNFTLSGKTNEDFKFEQPLNASSPIEDMLSGTVKLFKALQLEKVPFSISVTLHCRSTFVKASQLLNADTPIDDTLDAIVMLVK